MYDFNFFINERLYLSKRNKLKLISLIVFLLPLIYLTYNFSKNYLDVKKKLYSQENLQRLDIIETLEKDIGHELEKGEKIKNFNIGGQLYSDLQKTINLSTSIDYIDKTKDEITIEGISDSREEVFFIFRNLGSIYSDKNIEITRIDRMEDTYNYRIYLEGELYEE